jgi:hypothetical protein
MGPLALIRGVVRVGRADQDQRKICSIYLACKQMILLSPYGRIWSGSTNHLALRGEPVGDLSSGSLLTE